MLIFTFLHITTNILHKRNPPVIHNDNRTIEQGNGTRSFFSERKKFFLVFSFHLEPCIVVCVVNEARLIG